MKLAITTAFVNAQDTSYPISRKEALRMLCEGGFRYLDYNLDRELRNPAARQDSPLLREDWRSWCREMRMLAASCSSEFVQTHCVFPNYFADAPLDVECTGYVPRCIEATALLGAPVTVMHPIAPPGMEYDRKGTVAANREYFRKMGDVAAEHGVRIAVENMLSNRLTDGSIFKRCCTSAEELMELVEAIDHPFVGACVDVGHAHYMKQSAGDMIRMCGDRLWAFHFADNDTWNDSHVPPYCGTLNWEEVYQAIRDIHYEGGGMLECRACWRLPQEVQRSCIRYMADLCNYMMQRIEAKEE